MKGLLLTAPALAALAAFVSHGAGASTADLPSGDVKFTDITGAAGIKFTHNSGRAGKKFLPETLGAGAAFFDADGSNT